MRKKILLLLIVLLVALIAVSAYSLRRHVSRLPEITPHLVGPNDLLTSNENMLTPQEKELKHAAFSILLARGNATQENYDSFSLHAVGNRYLLMRFFGESDHYPMDTVIDLQEQEVGSSMYGYSFDTKDAVIYVDGDVISYYAPGTPYSLEISGTKLSDDSSETYYADDGMLPGPEETHTDTSITLSVFSLFDYLPPQNIERKKVRDVTIPLP